MGLEDMGEPVWPRPKPPAVPCDQARCDYCRRYGPLGACLGCGAPNQPVAVSGARHRPHLEVRVQQIETTAFRDDGPRFLSGLRSYHINGQAVDRHVYESALARERGRLS